MIKPNELRTGNYVHYTGTPYPSYPIKDGIVIVDEILQDGVNRSQGDSTLYNSEMLEGITLTPEWLDRLDVVKASGLYKLAHTDFFLRYIESKGVDISVEDLNGNKHYFRYGIKDIHELQNIYLDLIQEELTIKETV